MSAELDMDIAHLMEELGLGEVGTDIYTPRILAQRKASYGVLVEQRNTSPVPYALDHSDTSYINIQVRGAGQGDAGKRAAANRAMEIYRALNLVLDTRVEGTLYLLITPDSAPYPIEDGEHTDYLFGLEVKRYYGEDFNDNQN